MKLLDKIKERLKAEAEKRGKWLYITDKELEQLIEDYIIENISDFYEYPIR